jgi:transposase
VSRFGKRQICPRVEPLITVPETVRTLLYEAANVMLTRYKGPLKLKDWAFAIAKRSTMRKARIALARRLAIIMHAMLRHGTEFKPA